MWTPDTDISKNLTLWVTHECNMTCKFCRDSAHKGIKGFMSMSDVRKNLADAKANGITTILIGGGEPTLHPDIVEIAKLCKSLNFFTVITTNYTKPDVIKQLDGICDTINISVYKENEHLIPNQSDFKSVLCLKTLMYAGRWKNKADFDNFIYKYKAKVPNMVFGCMRGHTEWCKNHKYIDFYDEIEKESEIVKGSRGNPVWIYKGTFIDRKDLSSHHKRHMMVDVRGTVYNADGKIMLMNEKILENINGNVRV